MNAIKGLVYSIFPLPRRPPLVLPWYARPVAEQINQALDHAFELCYQQGLLNGFILGLIVATMFFVVLNRRRA